MLLFEILRTLLCLWMLLFEILHALL